MRLCAPFAVILLLTLMPIRTVLAENEALSASTCVSSIETGLLSKGGIATEQLADGVNVVFCDGKKGELSLLDDSLTITTREDSKGQEEAAGLSGTSEPLPDGEVTQSAGDKQKTALLSGPTSRYRHAILGDAIEASGFSVLDSEGKRVSFELDAASVFEDLRVRLIDLTGDGDEEFVVIRSYLDGGAALAAYGLKDGNIVPLGETPAIGLTNRWLNPAGAADFDGDGDIEIAYVETPHIGGTLRFVSLSEKGLVEERAIHGFSNHAIGSRVLDMAAVVDWNADGMPDLAIPDASRSRMQVVSLADGTPEVIDTLPEGEGRHAQRITSAVVGSDLNNDGKPELIYALSDGTLVLAQP